MNHDSSHVGMDVHKNEIVVAMVLRGEDAAIEWKLRNEPGAVRRLAKKLKREAVGELICVYEAGPCGYTLQRQLSREGIKTQVIAPSLIPRKPGERIKTDRRDARKLASLSRAGQLTEVHPPSTGDEAVRDLCRCREDAVGDQMRARHRLSKMLMRLGFVYRAGRNWTQAHRRWMRSLAFEEASTRVVFDDYLCAVEQLEERVTTLDRAISEVSTQAPYAERVGWLRCFRGVDTTTAMTILSELHDFRRFEDPRRLMAYLGLVPSEHSSGDRRRRGAITKAGNSHVRRVLVEASWHYRHRPAVGIKLRKRREGQPAEIIALADKAQRRLNRRYHRLVLGRGKPTQKAVVALARELAGFVWGALYLYPQLQQLREAA